MKKVLMAITVVGLIGLSACKKEENKIQETLEQTTQDVQQAVDDIQETANDVVNSVGDAPEIPQFSNTDVQKFAEEYSTYFNEMMAAAKTGDTTKLQELTSKGADLAKKAQEYTQKMSKEDAQKWTEWYSKLQTLASGN